MHAFSSESIPPRGLSLTHLAGKGLLVACHGHEAEKLAGMARIYIYPEPDLRPAYNYVLIWAGAFSLTVRAYLPHG